MKSDQGDESPHHGSAAEAESLLEYLRGSRGFDFTGYKRSSLLRRIDKRMQSVAASRYPDYVDYLEVHPEEFEHLFNTILINVTHFFRDEPAWRMLADEIIPGIIGAKKPSDLIRVWSAGCASGEEAYSLAILFAEAMGPETFRERVKIYATDLDEDALNRARHAIYSEHDVEPIPKPLRDKYFDLLDGAYAFRKDLRRTLIFGRHDLIQDAPISRVDLLVCRNTLMYFNAETQARILARFHFALNETGVLFLGRAETMLAHGGMFEPVDLKRRISRKVGGPSAREQRLLLAAGVHDDPPVNGHPDTSSLHESAFDLAPVAVVVVDLTGHLRFANARARAMFGLDSTDIGRPLQDLRVSYQPVELRSVIERAYAERRALTLKDVEWFAGSDRRWIDVVVAPASDRQGHVVGVGITFTETTTSRQLHGELERSRQELEGAYEELQATNEELETTNEELQSTVEELETTNEELQSTNEELETMNEELQSTNEELQTMNEELRNRADELNYVNGFLESILTSLRGAVIVVDSELRVLVWNHRAEDLWGLREEKVSGKYFLNLDVGFSASELKRPIRQCLSGEQSLNLEMDAVNRRGKPIRCRISCMPLANRKEAVRGVILMMEEAPAADGRGSTTARTTATSTE